MEKHCEGVVIGGGNEGKCVQLLLLGERGAAERLGVSSRTLWQLRKDGKIAFVPIGGRVLYAPADLEAFIASQRRPATAQESAPAEAPGKTLEIT